MKALDGVRVLDLTRALAGPYCTMMLGDYGADIIKIELPGVGDDTRRWAPPHIGEESAYYLSINRNKRSMTLNLRHERGRQIFMDLVKGAEVVVGEFHTGGGGPARYRLCICKGSQSPRRLLLHLGVRPDRPLQVQIRI